MTVHPNITFWGKKKHKVSELVSLVFIFKNKKKLTKNNIIIGSRWVELQAM